MCCSSHRSAPGCTSTRSSTACRETGETVTAYRIGIPIIEEFDLLDVSNAYEVFRWLAPFWTGHEPDVILIGHDCDGVKSGNEAVLKPHKTFEAMGATQLEVIFVPGGGTTYLQNATADGELLSFVRNQSAGT